MDGQRFFFGCWEFMVNGNCPPKYCYNDLKLKLDSDRIQALILV